MADVKVLLLNNEEEGLASPREGGDVEEGEVVTTRIKNFTDRFLLLKQLRALVRPSNQVVRRLKSVITS